jgi:hypothetical protein
MRKSLLSSIVAGLVLASAAIASAQTNTAAVPEWTKEQGVAIKTHSATQKDTPFIDPALKLQAGVELPQNATLHLIPESLKIGTPETHAYAIVNDHAVLVDRTTRKVIHIWE